MENTENSQIVILTIAGVLFGVMLRNISPVKSALVEISFAYLYSYLYKRDLGQNTNLEMLFDMLFYNFVIYISHVLAKSYDELLKKVDNNSNMNHLEISGFRTELLKKIDGNSDEIGSHKTDIKDLCYLANKLTNDVDTLQRKMNNL